MITHFYSQNIFMAVAMIFLWILLSAAAMQAGTTLAPPKCRGY
jgi:hypothetical protein